MSAVLVKLVIATLYLQSSAKAQVATLHVRLTRVEADINAKSDVDNALKDVAAVKDGGPARLVSIVETVDGTYEEHADVYDYIGDLFQKLDAIKSVLDEVAKVSVVQQRS